MMTGWIGKTWLANYTVNARITYATDFEMSPAPFVPIVDTKPVPSPTNQIPFGFSALSTERGADKQDKFAFAAAHFVRELAVSYQR